MMSYKLHRKIFLIVSLACLLFLFLTYVTREHDFFRRFFIFSSTAIYLSLIFLALFPTFLGRFVKLINTDYGFDLEYLNNNLEVKRVDKVTLNEIQAFHCLILN